MLGSNSGLRTCSARALPPQLHPSHGLPHSMPFNLYHNLWNKQGDTKIHTVQKEAEVREVNSLAQGARATWQRWSPRSGLGAAPPSSLPPSLLLGLATTVSTVA